MDLYRGVVSHRRWGPGPTHGFAYELYLALIDIDDASRSLSRLWPFSAFNSAAFSSFHESDHMKGVRRDGESLGAAVRRFISDRVPGWAPPCGSRTLLLTHLRTFGYCFNPISLYYVVDGAGAVDCIVAEVSNTPWDEMHIYLLHARAVGVKASREPRIEHSSSAAPKNSHVEPPLPISDAARVRLQTLGAASPLDFDALVSRFSDGAGAATDSQTRGGRRRRSPSPIRPSVAGAEAAPPLTSSADILRFRWKKYFHVSPFFGMDHEYDWRFSQPGNGTLLVQSRNLRQGECVFSTQLMLEASPATRTRLAYFLFVAFPLLTLRIQFWIHYEAVRLFRKGVGLFPHPTGATNTFVKTVEAIASPIIALVALVNTMRRAPSGNRHGK